MNTKIAYMYRDGSNYKTFSPYIIFKGKPSKRVFRVVKEFLQGESPFIPHQVGLEDLQGNLTCYDTFDYGDDHPYHTLTVFELTKEEPNTESNLNDFLKKLLDGVEEDYVFIHPKPTPDYVAKMIREGFIEGHHPYWELVVINGSASELSKEERESIAEQVEGFNTSGVGNVSWKIIT